MVMMMMMDERAERGWRRAGPASAGGYGRSQGRAAHLSTYRRQSPHRHARGEVSSAGHPTPRGNAALKEGVGAFRSPAVAPPLGSWGGGGGARKGWAKAANGRSTGPRPAVDGAASPVGVWACGRGSDHHWAPGAARATSPGWLGERASRAVPICKCAHFRSTRY